MKSFEPVYKELETLFIEKLPEYIDKVNKDHNDGIILKPFENQTLQEKCIKQPCFVFGFEEAEYSEKDRIIENIIFCVSFEIKLQNNFGNESLIFWRYSDAISRMIKDNVNNINFTVSEIKEKKIFIRINIDN